MGEKLDVLVYFLEQHHVGFSTGLTLSGMHRDLLFNENLNYRQFPVTNISLLITHDQPALSNTPQIKNCLILWLKNLKTKLCD